jgi:hypothetical protein
MKHEPRYTVDEVLSAQFEVGGDATALEIKEHLTQTNSTTQTIPRLSTSEIVQYRIDSFYDKTAGTYTREKLVSNHSELIEELSSVLRDTSEVLPQEGDHVFAVQDLTPIGKCALINSYWFQNGEFVAVKNESGPYGYITKWVSHNYLDGNT